MMPFTNLHARHPQTLQMTETLQMLDDVQVQQVAESLDITPRNAMILQIAQAMVDSQCSLEQLDEVISQFDEEAMRRTEGEILETLGEDLSEVSLTETEMELICDSITNLIMLSSAGGIGECGLDDETLVQLWQLFETIDPTESNHAAHLRDCLRDHTNYFDKDDPVVGDEG